MFSHQYKSTWKLKKHNVKSFMLLVNLTKWDESDALFVGGSLCMVQTAASSHNFTGVCFSSGWSIELSGTGTGLENFVGVISEILPVEPAK